MKDKILVDTNIFIYATDKYSEFYQRANQLLLNQEYELFTTSKNISEFFSVVTTLKHNPLSIIDAIKILDAIKIDCTIYFPNESSFSVFQNLLKKHQPKGLIIHDYEIASIGIANGVTKIATVNTKDFINIEEITLITI